MSGEIRRWLSFAFLSPLLLVMAVIVAVAVAVAVSKPEVQELKGMLVLWCVAQPISLLLLTDNAPGRSYLFPILTIASLSGFPILARLIWHRAAKEVW